MATTARSGSSVKWQDCEAGDEAGQVVRDQVEELARAGARQMLLAALEDEVNGYLQRERYQRSGDQNGPWAGVPRLPQRDDAAAADAGQRNGAAGGSAGA